MQRDIRFHIAGPVLQQVPMFRHCPSTFIREAVAALRQQLFCPDEYVVRKGEIGTFVPPCDVEPCLGADSGAGGGGQGGTCSSSRRARCM